MTFQYYNWEEVDINWEAVDMNWELVGIFINDIAPFIDIPIGGGKRKYDLEKINKLDDEKKRRIIKVACEIEGKEYIEYKYINEDITITADQIDIIVDKIIKNIKVDVQNIS